MKTKRIFSIALALCMAMTLYCGVAAAGRFTDVTNGDYFARAVDWAMDRNITDGTSPTTFSPNDPCTRAQIVTFLWRSKGSPAPRQGSPVFSDVPSDMYYTIPVRWAAGSGVTTGTRPSTFSPERAVTRAEAATFLWRAAGSPRASVFSLFSDVPANAYYRDAVGWAQANNITEGTSLTTFSPDDPCTRAQIVTLLYRQSVVYSGSDAPSLATNYPVILVHGLLGWGSYDDINPLIPYWGMTACSVIDHLRSCGADVYAASVGPISSAWDRACELYAQLTGTVTDYGAAHAKLHGHNRYGRDYSGGKYSRLIPGPWDAQHPVNLAGHSFGGVTCRLMLDLLSDGSDEERAYMRAHPEEGAISPLFTGGKADWVYSITTLAAPSNGTTFIGANQFFTDTVETLTQSLSRLLGLTAFKGVYDFQLEHFGLQPYPGDDLTQALDRILNSSFEDHHDSAYQDLTIDRSMFINETIQMQPGVYYISYYGNRTYQDPATGNSLPNDRMLILAYPFSYNMCKYGAATRGSFVRGFADQSYNVNVTPTYTGREWQPNDGLVNTMSGRWPFHYENGRLVEDPHIIVNTQTVKATQKGVWYVMPELPFDHLTFMGSIFNENGNEVNAFYHDVLENIISFGG